MKKILNYLLNLFNRIPHPKIMTRSDFEYQVKIIINKYKTGIVKDITFAPYSTNEYKFIVHLVERNQINIDFIDKSNQVGINYNIICSDGEHVKFKDVVIICKSFKNDILPLIHQFFNIPILN